MADAAPLVTGAVYGTHMVGKRKANHDRRCAHQGGIHSYTMPDFPTERRNSNRLNVWWSNTACSWVPILYPYRRKGDERRSPAQTKLYYMKGAFGGFDFFDFYRRRKGDERRVLATTVRKWSGCRLHDHDERRKLSEKMYYMKSFIGPIYDFHRRRKGDERRRVAIGLCQYMFSDDPRIRALERRKS